MVDDKVLERRKKQAIYRAQNRDRIRSYQREWERKNRLKGLRINAPRKEKGYFKVSHGNFVISFDI